MSLLHPERAQSSPLAADKTLTSGVDLTQEYRVLVDQINVEQQIIKKYMEGSVFQRYILIILITLCGSLQIALNYRLSNGYYNENSHQILTAMNNRDLDEDDTDRKFSINDMSDFSNTFISSLVNLAMVSDNIFQYEPIAGQQGNYTQYTLEVFHKMSSTEQTSPIEHVDVIPLTEADLTSLTVDNFGENTGLNFDIGNATQLRYFLSDLYFISAKASNLTLLSFDNENSLVCQNWTMKIDFSFSQEDEVQVTKTVEYSQIPCLSQWKQELNYTDEDYDDSPIRYKEFYFINYVSLLCNLVTYYYVMDLILSLAKLTSLDRQKTIKQRWITQRENVQKYIDHKAWAENYTEQKEAQKIDSGVLFNFSNVVLIFANTFLLLANIFVILNTLKWRLGSDGEYEYYTRVFLGLGTSLSWANVVSLLAQLKTFRVVSYSIRASAKGVALLLFGILPLFFAFLFGAYCMFHEHERFETLTKTAGGLSALLAGDEILDFINALRQYEAVGTIFAMVFCVTFIICIHNVFVYIVVQSFKTNIALLDKNDRIEKQKRMNLMRKTLLNSAELIQQENWYDRPGRFGNIFEDSVISKQIFEIEAVKMSDMKLLGAQNQIFNKIIPQSRDKFRQELSHKKSVIYTDISSLLESIESFIGENIGRNI